MYEVSAQDIQLVNALKKVALCGNCVRRSRVEGRLQPSDYCDSCSVDTQVLIDSLWMKNCLMIDRIGESKRETYFTASGDSGSLLFEIDTNDKLLGFGIIFGLLENNLFRVATASPLHVALETLSTDLPGKLRLLVNK